jgi:hypothetical protein
MKRENGRRELNPALALFLFFSFMRSFHLFASRVPTQIQVNSMSHYSEYLVYGLHYTTEDSMPHTHTCPLPPGQFSVLKSVVTRTKSLESHPPWRIVLASPCIQEPSQEQSISYWTSVRWTSETICFVALREGGGYLEVYPGRKRGRRKWSRSTTIATEYICFEALTSSSS